MRLMFQLRRSGVILSILPFRNAMQWRPLQGSASLLIRRPFLVSSSGANPRVQFRQFEFPKPADAMGGHSLGFDPTVDSVPDDPQMGGNFLDGRPRLNRSAP